MDPRLYQVRESTKYYNKDDINVNANADLPLVKTRLNFFYKKNNFYMKQK